MAIILDKLKVDIYIHYTYGDIKFRYESETNKYYRRFYGQKEEEIPDDSALLRYSSDSPLTGYTPCQKITRDEYYSDVTNTILNAFALDDVYIDYPYEDAKFRYEKKTGRYYRRFYGKEEVEIPKNSNLLNEAISAGKQITKEEYFSDG